MILTNKKDTDHTHKDCENCGGKGYIHTNDENWNYLLARCDTCQVFSSDSEAQIYWGSL